MNLHYKGLLNGVQSVVAQMDPEGAVLMRSGERWYLVKTVHGPEGIIIETVSSHDAEEMIAAMKPRWSRREA